MKREAKIHFYFGSSYFFRMSADYGTLRLK